MQKATSSIENAKYNDETLFLDGIYGSHPEIFQKLSADELQVLKKYYLIGQQVPPNIFEYRRDLVTSDAEIADNAKVVFAKILELLKMDSFHYSTLKDVPE